MVPIAVCEQQSTRDKDNECVRESVCMDLCVHVTGVVREMSLLLRVTDINLWESCTLQHTLTEGDGESRVENAIYCIDDIYPTSQADFLV